MRRGLGTAAAAVRAAAGLPGPPARRALPARRCRRHPAQVGRRGAAARGPGSGPGMQGALSGWAAPAAAPIGSPDHPQRQFRAGRAAGRLTSHVSTPFSSDSLQTSRPCFVHRARSRAGRRGALWGGPCAQHTRSRGSLPGPGSGAPTARSPARIASHAGQPLPSAQRPFGAGPLPPLGVSPDPATEGA